MVWAPRKEENETTRWDGESTWTTGEKIDEMW